MSPPASSARASTSTPSSPRRPRRRCATPPRRARSLASPLDDLLFVGGRPSWQNPELPSLHRLPPRATLERDPATVRSLDGPWEFRLVDRPEAAARALRAARGWSTVEVPGLWTMQGFERPHYTNVQMPFPEPPPTVPAANPTGIYRRLFRVPAAWRRRPVLLQFAGVE